MSAPSRQTDYAPAKSDPVRLAAIILKGMDQIGAITPDEIDRLAGQIEEDAKKLADELREFSAGVRGQWEIAVEQIGAHFNKSNDVIETMRALEERLFPAVTLEAPDLQRDETDLPVPEFLVRANGNGAVSS